MGKYDDYNEIYDTQFSDLTVWKLFYGEKDDWYETKENGKKDWSKSEKKINIFWSAVQELKMKKDDFDFESFCFPKYQSVHSFWLEGEERQFLHRVTFKDATFLGEAIFDNIKFSTYTSFDGCTFNSHASFLDSEFLNDCTTFNGTAFLGDAIFNGAKFYGFTDFHNTSIGGDGDFFTTLFSSETNFIRMKFLGEAYFIRTTFLGETHFDTLEVSSEKTFSFETWEVKGFISFNNVVFTDRLKFHKCDLSKVSFYGCNLIRVNFSNCIFSKRRNRLVLANDKSEDFGNLCNMYRQLKKNFMDTKDWINAGDAYRSEMVMTRRLIWNEFLRSPIQKFHLFFNWLIRIIYEYCSGYQQSITRPLFCLFFLVFGVPLITMDGQWDCYNHALKESINAALPIVGRIPEATENFYLLVFERIFSVVFLAFFILATRARLRQ